VFSECNVGRYPTADDVNNVSIFIIAPAQLKLIISIMYDIKGGYNSGSLRVKESHHYVAQFCI